MTKLKKPSNSLLKGFIQVISSGFEPETDRLEICCSIQLSYETIETKMSNGECLYIQHYSSFFVGVAGFEPTTSTSQMWRDTGLRYTPSPAITK